MTQRHLSPASGSPLRRSTEAHERRNYVYPPVPMPQQPPSAHITDAKRVSEGQTTGATRVHGSRSSVSGSSGTSNQKRQTSSPCSQWPSPALERTLVDSGGHHPSPSTPWQPAGSARTGHSPKRTELTQHTSPTMAYIRDQQQIEEEDGDEEEEDHALWILFWLSCLDPVHCFASCLFTVFVTFGLLLASPIRLCKKQRSFGDQIIRALAPIFKHHLEVMYAPSADYAFEWDFRPSMLIFIQIVSPLLSIGVAIASWVTAAFWVFTSIMGNPDGTERRDDGRDAVLAIRNWWESCLLIAIRPRIRPPIRSVV